MARKPSSGKLEAALAQANVNLAHTRILAPVSGTVDSRHFDIGQTVAASFQAPDIFDIAQDLTKMQVDTNADRIGCRHDTGRPVSYVRRGRISCHNVQGTVVDVRKAPISQQNVVTYDVVISVSNPDLKLFPGMTANVSILTDRQENVLKVPNAALRFHPSADVLKQAGISPSKGSGQQLYLLNAGKLSAMPVKLGISDGKATAVSGNGLKVGDSAVIRATTSKTSTNSGATPTTPRIPRI